MDNGHPYPPIQRLCWVSPKEPLAPTVLYSPDTAGVPASHRRRKREEHDPPRAVAPEQQLVRVSRPSIICKDSMHSALLLCPCQAASGTNRDEPVKERSAHWAVQNLPKQTPPTTPTNPDHTNEHLQSSFSGTIFGRHTEGVVLLGLTPKPAKMQQTGCLELETGQSHYMELRPWTNLFLCFLPRPSCW